MRITPYVQGPRLSLEAARALPANFTSFENFPEKTSSITLGLNKSLAGCDLRFLFDYQIFPPNVLRSVPVWRAEGRPEMRLGDVIIQRAFVPPIGGGICLEFAVRVRELFSEANRIGFSYETLAGHPEQGISEFYFTKDDDGVRFFIHTFSRPGHWTSRASSGLAIRYQSWCTQRVLECVGEQFALHNRDLPG
jgi:hypothetical protein